MKKLIISILPCIKLIQWNKRLLKSISFLAITFILSCQPEEEPEPLCTPGTRRQCDFVYGGCWDVYDDCSRYSAIQISISSPEEGYGYKPIVVGQHITIHVEILIGILTLESVDSITIELCNKIFKRTLPVLNNVGYYDFASYYTQTLDFIVPDNIEPGSYNFVAKAWSKGGAIHKDERVFDIYPKGDIPTDLISNDKVNILVYVPMNTPSNSIIYIAQGATDWPFVDVDTVAMHKLDAYRSYISIDFKSYEQFTFIRDFPKDSTFPPYSGFTFCAMGSGGTCEYRDLIYYEGAEVILPTPGSQHKLKILGWSGSSSLPTTTLCVN